MPSTNWEDIDHYLNDHGVDEDASLASAVQRSKAAGLPEIQVAPNQGKLLSLLVQGLGAKRVLEVGTLGGYSTLWLARGLGRDGRIVTLELDPKHAAVASDNLTRAGVRERVDLRVGPALDSLAKLAEERPAPFDFVFIDADKANIPHYFDWALRLARVGTWIVVDNVVRKGAILDPASSDPNVQGVRRFFERLKGERRVTATAVQTVGSKGHDGLAFAVVTAEA